MKKSDKTKQMISWGKTSRRNITGGENSPVEVLSESGGYLCIFGFRHGKQAKVVDIPAVEEPGLSDEGIDTPMDKLKNN